MRRISYGRLGLIVAFLMVLVAAGCGTVQSIDDGVQKIDDTAKDLTDKVKDLSETANEIKGIFSGNTGDSTEGNSGAEEK